MTTFKVEDQDFALSINNGLVVLVGLDEARERNEAHWRVFKGEWFLDPQFGFAFRDFLGQKAISLSVIEAQLKNEILKIEGNTEILAFNLSIDARERTVSVQYEVKTVDGHQLKIVASLDGRAA